MRGTGDAEKPCYTTSSPHQSRYARQLPPGEANYKRTPGPLRSAAPGFSLFLWTARGGFQREGSRGREIRNSLPWCFSGGLGGEVFSRKDLPPRLSPAFPKAENARKARRLLLTSDPSCKERGYNEMKRNCLLQVL